MNRKQKQPDLTRDEARLLAEAKWGADGYTTLGFTRRKGCVIGRAVRVVGRPVSYVAFTGSTWREACERAGLLSTQSGAPT